MICVLRSTPLAALALLAACAQVPAPQAPAPKLLAPPVAAVDTRRSEAIARHRNLAKRATEDGDLATAATQWQLVTLLAPEDDTYQSEWTAVRAAIATSVKNHLQMGFAAMAKGDLERASQAMLRALALDPNQFDAATALREIDRQRYTRIQANRVARARLADKVAGGASRTKTVGSEPDDALELGHALDMLRSGDATGGIRDLKSLIDANPQDHNARQRIATAIAERALELENHGSREQALLLYEQATLLRGETTAPWAARVPALRRAISKQFFDMGTRAYRTNVTQAITFFETSLRYDPANTQAALKLEHARAAHETLDRIDNEKRKP